MVHVRVGAYDLALGSVYGITHRELCTCAVSFLSHTCATVSPLLHTRGGAQHIAAPLAHNFTLQTLT
jgi:hypothetical protein